MFKIKAVFHVVCSKMDAQGNRYFFTRYTDTASGEQVTFLSERDTYQKIRCQLGLKWDEAMMMDSTEKIRTFRLASKRLTYGMANDFIVGMSDKKRAAALHIKQKNS